MFRIFTQDRYFYAIEEIDHQKHMHVEGNIYPIEDGFELDEWSGCYIDMSELRSRIKNDTLFSFLNENVKYADTIPESDKAKINKYYTDYFDNKSCDALGFDDINETTPCGYYYCDRS